MMTARIRKTQRCPCLSQRRLSVAEVRFPNLIAFWQATRVRRHRLRRFPNTNEVRFRPHHLQLQVCARLKTTRAGGG